MQNNDLPSHCFQQTELEHFLSLEGQTLEQVHYFTVPAARAEYLHALELLFAEGPTLLLAADAEEPAMRAITPEQLMATARDLKSRGLALHLLDANRSALWAPLVGETLRAILLSKNEDGLSANDALVFDFGAHRLLLSTAETMGLAVSAL
ncbi:MAG: hypothetical protein SFV52_15385 [Saprospiraceae bacterium]|nr:hypothetical protein [Saprospiraceae bacterium]